MQTGRLRADRNMIGDPNTQSKVNPVVATGRYCDEVQKIEYFLHEPIKGKKYHLIIIVIFLMAMIIS